MSSNQNLISHQVPPLKKKQRIDDYAKNIFFQYPTKTSIKKALKKNLLRVNGDRATTATWINGGEIITVQLPEIQSLKTKLELDLEVIFEDDHLAIINKPAGVQVSGNRLVTIANALPQNLRPSTEEDACLTWPVHRLDYGTTGVLVVGKTAHSIRSLNKQFQEQEVKKTYYAAAIGKMPLKGTIDSVIDGKTAITHFEVHKTVSSKRFDQLNLVMLHPETGRRHQIRKHLAELGNPILGDKDYYKDGLILNGKGIYLHAFEIQLKHPHSDQLSKWHSPLPKKYLKIFPDIFES